MKRQLTGLECLRFIDDIGSSRNVISIAELGVESSPGLNVYFEALLDQGGRNGGSYSDARIAKQMEIVSIWPFFLKKTKTKNERSCRISCFPSEGDIF